MDHQAQVVFTLECQIRYSKSLGQIIFASGAQDKFDNDESPVPGSNWKFRLLFYLRITRHRLVPLYTPHSMSTS